VSNASCRSVLDVAGNELPVHNGPERLQIRVPAVQKIRDRLQTQAFKNTVFEQLHFLFENFAKTSENNVLYRSFEKIV